VRKFEFLDHTGDLGIRAFGRSLTDLFRHSAEAFFQVITDPETIRLPVESLLFLAQTHPAESQRWLNDLPPDLLHRGRQFFRAVKNRLPEDFVLLLAERGA